MSLPEQPADQARWPWPLFGFTAGLVFFLWLYGLKLADPFSYSWLLSPQFAGMGTDMAQHFVGWLYFLNTDWDFPLGRIPNYLPEFNLSVAYTDSIPWLAVVAKLITPTGTHALQYSGLWFLASFALNGLFAAIVLQRLTREPMALVAGIVFAITSPALVTRAGHIALCGQWLILAAIAWQLSYVRRATSHTSASGHLPLSTALTCYGLSAFSCISHPYIGAMVSTILLCSLLAFGTLRERLGRAFVLCGANMLALFVFGYFPNPTERTGSSQYWSADLFTFFNSMDRSGLLPGFRTWGGQYEGFAFIGSGAIMLFLFALYVAKTKGLRQHLAPLFNRPLVVALGVLYVYALSSNIRVFSKWLISLGFLYAPLEPITAAFRASGRFTWPTHYMALLVLVAIPSLVLKNRNHARLLVGLAIALQLVCQYPVWQDIRTRQNTVELAQYAPLAEAMQGKTDVKLIPPFINYLLCSEERYPNDYWVPLAFQAAVHNQRINSGSMANPNADKVLPYCARELDTLRTGGVQAGVLYVVQPSWYEKEGARYFAGSQCAQRGQYFVCQAASLPGHAQGSSPATTGG